jgi:nicotinamidase-related amidase
VTDVFLRSRSVPVTPLSETVADVLFNSWDCTTSGASHGRTAYLFPHTSLDLPMPTALLVIDVQRALCTGADAAFDIDAVIARINAVTAAARTASAPVIFIRHEESDGPLVEGSPGWQLDDRLTVHPDDLLVGKTATDSFHRTALQATLQSHGIDALVVCGLQSEFCVDSTVRGALAHGYPVTLVSDGHSTVDNGVLPAAQISAHHTATLVNVGSFGPRVTAVPAAGIRFVS